MWSPPARSCWPRARWPGNGGAASTSAADRTSASLMRAASTPCGGSRTPAAGASPFPRACLSRLPSRIPRPDKSSPAGRRGRPPRRKRCACRGPRCHGPALIWFCPSRAIPASMSPCGLPRALARLALSGRDRNGHRDRPRPGAPDPAEARRSGLLSRADAPEEWDRLYNTGDKFPRRPELWSNYVVGDAHNLPVPDNSIDFIFGSHVFEHLANPLGHLERWRRKLRPGGKVLCVIPDLNGTKDALQTPTGPVDWLAEYHAEQWEPTPEQYARYFRKPLKARRCRRHCGPVFHSCPLLHQHELPAASDLCLRAVRLHVLRHGMDAEQQGFPFHAARLNRSRGPSGKGPPASTARAVSLGCPAASARKRGGRKAGKVRRPLMARARSRTAGRSGAGCTGRISSAPNRPWSAASSAAISVGRRISPSRPSALRQRAAATTHASSRCASAMCARARASWGEAR